MSECHAQCSHKTGMCGGDLPPCAVESIGEKKQGWIPKEIFDEARMRCVELEVKNDALKAEVNFLRNNQPANSAMVPCPTCGAACSIGGDDEEETHYFIPVVPFRAQGQ